MARGTTTYTQAYGSLVNYKNLYQSLSTVLNQAATRTADTGQVNWATIATEPSTVRDYEVFALGGPLQSTAPVFLRIDYQGASVAGAGAYITVGTTTDGAGNLGGLTVAKQGLQNHTITNTLNLSAWAACDGSYFTFLYALDPVAAGTDGVGMFVVERTRDLTGAATANGFHVWRWYATTAAATAYLGGWSRTFASAAQTANTDYNFGVTVPDAFNATTSLDNNIGYAYPAYTYTPLAPGGASKALLFAFPNDFPRGQSVTVTHYGEAMTFVPLADSVTTGIPVMSAAATGALKSLSPMIRFD